MNGSKAIDVVRLIRIVTVFLSILVGSLIYFTDLPRVEAAQYRIDDAEAALRSSEVARAATPRLRAERDLLATRYARLSAQNADALFLRELVAIAQSRHLTLVTTSLTRAAGNEPAAGASTALATHGTLELRGAYRDLLIAIARLSAASQVVEVEPPSLRRDGNAVVAAVPVTIYAPAPAPAAVASPQP